MKDNNDEPVQVQEPKEVECPFCEKRGEVRARRDAYQNYRLILTDADSATWEKTELCELDDVVYECFACGLSINEQMLESHNGIIL